MDTGSLPSRWDSYARRLPSSLEDLRGPAAGVIELPLHVAWSGRRVYDVGQEDQRLVLYALLLAAADISSGLGCGSVGGRPADDAGACLEREAGRKGSQQGVAGGLASAAAEFEAEP